MEMKPQTKWTTASLASLSRPSMAELDSDTDAESGSASESGRNGGSEGSSGSDVKEASDSKGGSPGDEADRASSDAAAAGEQCHTGSRAGAAAGQRKTRTVIPALNFYQARTAAPMGKRKRAPPPARRGKEKKKRASTKESEEMVEALDEEVIERVLDCRPSRASPEDILVKYKGVSYRRTAWLPVEEVRTARAQLLRNYLCRAAEPSDGVDPEWLRSERMIAQRVRGGGQQFLVKWCQLPYTQATWEDEAALTSNEDQEQLRLFWKREMVPAKARKAGVPKKDAVPEFLNGRELRDYQLASLQWMMQNRRVSRNCILGDEMGLGKTAQSIATLEFQRQLLANPGPFLVIAPLTTLGHWKREIETWTPMNAVLYAGDAADRALIQEHELRFAGDPKSSKRAKFNILLASYEMVAKDASVFQRYTWETVIVDEGHRLKSSKGHARRVIEALSIKWLLLLTGTPIQNNMAELHGIMSLLDAEEFGDEDDFLERYGGGRANPMPDPEQVHALQEALRPRFLRRMKEDVETLPEKEEVVVWVELTAQQRIFYKGIYEGRIGALLAGTGAKNLPNLNNLAMQLRKVCCHPFLCEGLEQDVASRKAGMDTAELLTVASGKMLLLHKLLPKLRREGHKVLIFSQFTRMLDILEDYLAVAQYPCERIDGSVGLRERQAAIDRYSKEGSDGFAFLLSTRAGGQGITLTAADTVIIYDSDWNPQNDLQAMARCHRIGQAKEVTIYRLVSRDTYEQNVFDCASRKQGLDHAILGGISSEGEKADAERIADLLKHGAHALGAAEDRSLAAGADFASEDIDAILAGRTEKRQIGSAAGNTFSTATFAAEPAAAEAMDERAYWAAVLPEAVASHDAQLEAEKAALLGPRRRREVTYYESRMARAGAADDAGLTTGREGADEDFAPTSTAAKSSDEDSAGSGLEEGADGVAGKRKRRSKGQRRLDDGGGKAWTHKELKAVEDGLVALGTGRAAELREQAGGALDARSEEKVAVAEAVLVGLIERAARIDGARSAKKQAEQEAAACANPDLQKVARELLQHHDLLSPASGLSKEARLEVPMLRDLVVACAPTVTAVAVRLDALISARKEPLVNPRLQTSAARPLADALTAAWVESTSMPATSALTLEERKEQARAAAVVAMMKATKSKAGGAAGGAAPGEGEGEDALGADAPLVPAGWALPRGMRQACEAPAFQERLVRNGAKYALALRQRTALAQVANGLLAPDKAEFCGLARKHALDAALRAKRPRALPEWWATPKRDLELLKAAHRRGFYSGSRKNPAEALLTDAAAPFKRFFRVVTKEANEDKAEGQPLSSQPSSAVKPDGRERWTAQDLSAKAGVVAKRLQAMLAELEAAARRPTWAPAAAPQAAMASDEAETGAMLRELDGEMVAFAVRSSLRAAAPAVSKRPFAEGVRRQKASKPFVGKAMKQTRLSFAKKPAAAAPLAPVNQ
ncbi:hypothetical protein WJX81_005199 [Elliptochloris bilobata]|uniref:Uncharacterized protein n=1 Tax=Elliptochloris bilobata TaxID=381761 RepID=A0AAW1RIA3_9CHLO